MPLIRHQTATDFGTSVSSLSPTFGATPGANRKYWAAICSNSSGVFPTGVTQTNVNWGFVDFINPTGSSDLDLWVGVGNGGTPGATVNISYNTLANVVAIVGEYEYEPDVQLRVKEVTPGADAFLDPGPVSLDIGTGYAGFVFLVTEYNNHNVFGMTDGFSTVVEQASFPAGAGGAAGHITAHLFDKLPHPATGSPFDPRITFSTFTNGGSIFVMQTMDPVTGSVLMAGESLIAASPSRQRVGSSLIQDESSGLFVPSRLRAGSSLIAGVSELRADLFELPDFGLPGYPVSAQNRMQEFVEIGLKSDTVGDPNHHILVDGPNDFRPGPSAPAYDLDALNILPGDKIRLVGTGPNNGRTLTLSNPGQLTVVEQILNSDTDVTPYQFEVIRRKS